MKKKILILLIGINLLGFTSCNLDGLQSNPNLLTPDQSNIAFLVNSVEVEFGTNFFYNASYTTMDLTRLKALTRGYNYNNCYTPADFNGVWYSFYSTMLPDIASAIKIGSANGQTIYTGIARSLKAYALVTMVDLFGDIPYTEAQSTSNFNPKVDKAGPLYDTALAILDHAIADLAIASKGADYTDDVFYGAAKTPILHRQYWTTFAKTLKLRIYHQRRLVDNGAHAAIAAIVASGDYIGGTTGCPDFVFPYYGNSITNPDTRSPMFYNNYLNGASDYMSNSLMVEMYDYNNLGLGIPDPRLRYYFYRQQDTPGTDVNAIACVGQPIPAHYPAGTAWCQGPNGYWGRDHGNNDGTGPDTKGRSVWGIYPGGGKFDADQGVPVTVTDGNAGKGEWPILTSSFVNFMLAEDALVAGDAVGAGAYLNLGVAQSITAVMGFSSVGVTKAPSAAAISNYKNQVANDFTAATDKMQVIMKEYWKALFGNGIDMYNSYRRTGHPTDMQPMKNPDPGDFYRALIYPAVTINYSSNATQHADNTQVFWDTNPADPWIF